MLVVFNMLKIVHKMCRLLVYIPNFMPDDFLAINLVVKCSISQDHCFAVHKAITSTKVVYRYIFTSIANGGVASSSMILIT